MMRSTPNRSRIGRLAALVAAILLVAACTDTGGSDARSPAPTGSLTPATSTGASASAGKLGGHVVNAVSGSVGAYLTGDDGRTLYTFKPDSANTSACTGACATTWPPFAIATGDTPTAGSGVPGTLTTFARADGSMQVAYNGAPLYYFAGDAKAGETGGQGVGGVWFVAAP
jgi:predicted lipoprotein with Yx(FWY)xxD motif